MPDAQTVEIAGRNLLVSALVAAGFEVARPERDRGIDLIAYMDLVPPFTAVPIQMKASAGTAVTLLRKYEKFDRLLTILVWNALVARKVQFFGLSRATWTPLPMRRVGHRRRRGGATSLRIMMCSALAGTTT